MDKDMKAFRIIDTAFSRIGEYREDYDVLYHYMKSYIAGPTAETCMFLDEVENLIGLNNHRSIVDYIVNEVK